MLAAPATRSRCLRGFPLRHVRYAHVSPASSPLLQRLESRGLLKDVSAREQCEAHLCRGRVGIYAGIDPTAPSLHVGHLLVLMPLLYFQLDGHRVFALVGGATGMVGDPSGRSQERPQMDTATLNHNVTSLRAQLDRVIANGRAYAQARLPHLTRGHVTPITVLNNYDWFRDVSLLDFLRHVGSRSRLQRMLSRDVTGAVFASRLSREATGLTFTELSYQLLQAYDFDHLHRQHNVTLQLGGSDQWGNIVAGIELVGRSGESDAVFGLTTPLITTKSGAKLGKSAGNAVWLDPQKTSPIDMYQYFVNTAEEDIERYLLMLTMLPAEQIQCAMDEHRAGLQARRAPSANHLLAREVVHMIHGEAESMRAALAARILHSNDFSGVTVAQLCDVFADRTQTLARHAVVGHTLRDLVAQIMHTSKKEAERNIVSGAITVNGERCREARTAVTDDMLLDQRALAIKYAKSQLTIVLVA